jgi:hypothetical protein
MRSIDGGSRLGACPGCGGAPWAPATRRYALGLRAVVGARVGSQRARLDGGGPWPLDGNPPGRSVPRGPPPTRVKFCRRSRGCSVGCPPQLLELFRDWSRIARRQVWLFPGQNPVNHPTTRQLNRAVHAAAQIAEITNAPSRAAHFMAHLRDYFALY